jgi:uncharacterized protein
LKARLGGANASQNKGNGQPQSKLSSMLKKFKKGL